MAEPKRFARLVSELGPQVAPVALALLLGFVAIALLRQDLLTAADAYLQMLYGGLGDWPGFFSSHDPAALFRPWGEAATRATLLLCTGLSVAVAFRVGLFNIGAQGQLVVGGLLAAIVGAKLELPTALHLSLAVIAALVGGALYGLVPAALRLWRGVHEVISTIMLNWVALSVVENWLVPGPLRAKAQGTLSVSGTDEIHPSAMLPRLLGADSRLHLGFVLALGCCALVGLWLSRTRMGFETRAVGHNLAAARTAGIAVERRTLEAMAIAGALAGLAGACLVLGTEYKFPAAIAAPYGFDGIAIALIGQTRALGVLLAALFFGALRAGGPRLQLFGIHPSFPELLQGLSLLLVAAHLGWVRLFARKRAAAVGGA